VRRTQSREPDAAPTPSLLVARVSARDEEDLALVEALARICFDAPEGTEGGSFSIAAELERPWSRVWSARSAEGAAPAAFLVAWHIADELHVLNVATAPELRRRGFARALMDEALAYAARERVRLVLLEVRRSNRAAIKLYRGLAFTVLGVRPRYYSDNDEDAIEMILSLDPRSGDIVPGRDEIRIDG
jgi:ribosomal-protein-alanine N-acetyltransferase